MKLVLAVVIVVLILTIAENLSLGSFGLLKTGIIGILILFIGFDALKYFGLGTIQGKSTLFILSGVMIWVLGDLLWLFYTGGTGEVSYADIFYLFGYLSLIFGIILGLKTLSGSFDTSKIISFSAIGMIIVLVYFYFFPIFWNSQSTFYENIVTSSYTIADFILLALSISAMLFSISGTHSRSWMVLSFATLFVFIGDIIYALLFDTYESGILVDVPYYVGYVLYSVSFALLQHNAQKTMSIMKEKIIAKKNKVT